jgi:hypothetical protein
VTREPWWCARCNPHRTRSGRIIGARRERGSVELVDMEYVPGEGEDETIHDVMAELEDARRRQVEGEAG